MDLMRISPGFPGTKFGPDEYSCLVAFLVHISQDGCGLNEVEQFWWQYRQFSSGGCSPQRIEFPGLAGIFAIDPVGYVCGLPLLLGVY